MSDDGRTDGRTDGRSNSRAHVGILWCANQRHRKGNGWAFPPNVRRKLVDLTANKRVGHFFGGLAPWGIRLDVDPAVRPHVIGNAWLAPFRRDAFDVVVLDPPYVRLRGQEKRRLFDQAAWCAREWVIWFHTVWVAANAGMTLEDAWLVRVGDSCHVRCLQVFRVVRKASAPPDCWATGGPALRYNRWLTGQRGLFQPEVVS